MSFSIRLGNFLYRYCFFIYRPLYTLFKNRQDAFEIRLLKENLKEGDQVLDIGANIGYYARIISRLVGNSGHVHCFEPDPGNFKRLQESVGSYKNVSLHQKAVGPRTETLKIYTSPELNVDHRTYEPEVYDKIIEVQALSMDDYLRGKDTGNLKLIKMDIQGFEMQALQGMRETIKKTPGLLLISEFWPYGLRKAGSSLTEYFNALCGLGFECHLLKNDRLEKLSAENVQALAQLGQEHYFNILAKRTHV